MKSSLSPPLLDASRALASNQDLCRERWRQKISRTKEFADNIPIILFYL
jgi:hypothetical protein